MQSYLRTTVLILIVSWCMTGTGLPRTYADDALAAASAVVPVASPDLAAVETAVESAILVPNCTGRGLLLPGTRVEALRWAGNVLEIDLALPPLPGDWYLSPLDQEALAAILAGPFHEVPGFGGTRIRARVGSSDVYDSLEQFLPQRPEPAPPPPPPDEVALTLEEAERLAPPLVTETRGQFAQAARQPLGALTGVTVFTSAGHGWTAGQSSWYLQRPVLLNMCEDYGNIDQMNYFVAYAFNAGATVVPFRPVGWQPIEIVLDNDDPGVTFTGTWNNGSSSKYYENGVTLSGIVYKWASASPTENAVARYTPNITVTDFYPVYCFTIASSNRVRQKYRIAHSGGISEVTVDHRLVGNGWIWLGDYYLVAGGNNYVEISNQATETGAVIADAIRWGCGMGDIVRPGPGTISGYPRDEECSRYWAQSELGNRAVGFDSDIWDVEGLDDGSDNVRTAAKWAREMNQEPADLQVDRWKRIYLEFHSNATNGQARGQICLITDLGATTYQTQFATMLSDEVDGDMLIVDDDFEYTWYDRSAPTYTSSYGAICTPANGNEFDATIIEVAFHDNAQDAALLRDDRVRAALARSCVQGIIRFLNTLPGSQIPLAFPPDTPRDFRALDNGDGTVTLAWTAPLSDAARGDPATGYVIYQSSNGYGFGSPIVLGNVTSTTISDLPAGETRYFRVAATNAGGESMPTEVLAVRRPAAGRANILIVNGFDRLRRQLNPVQTFTQPPNYAGQSIERQIWRRSNSGNYVVQHAEALAANGYCFSSCANEVVAAGQVNLSDFDFVVWILGNESGEDLTLTSTEQTRLSNYLNAGGGLFITGADLAYDLIGLSHGASFCQNTLKVGYSADDANTYQVTPDPNGIFAGLAAFDFSPANGAPYDVFAPDVLTARTGARACLSYVGGSGGVAAVQYYGCVYNTVTFGFPFECISSPTVRAQVMDRVIQFLATAQGPLPYDYNGDCRVDWTDFGLFRFCFSGPDNTYASGHICLKEDGDADADVDLADFAGFQRYYTR